MTAKNDWLAASSFEQAHEVASAINTLSIHAKLLLDGITDPAPAEEVQQARQRLRAFLARLQAVLEDAQRAGAVVGADPQLGDVALRFLSRQQGQPGKRATPGLMVELPALIESERPDELRRLVTGLHELRSLVDVHAPSEPVQLVDG
jgi:glutathione S-transferase